MKVGICWNLSGVDPPHGVFLAINPTCPIWLMDKQPCGLPATVRTTNGLHWSHFDCAYHAGYHLLGFEAWDRLAPDVLDRAFVNRASPLRRRVA